MAKFIVDRRTWYRGCGSTFSYLLNKSKRCCIGFVGQQCGIPDSNLEGRYAVDSAEVEENWPAWMCEQEDGSTFCDTKDISLAYYLNDSYYISDAEREENLKALFKKHGDEIGFVN